MRTPIVLDVPAKPFGAPVLVQLAIRPRLAEVLHLHQLELAQPKDEVSRRDLVAKSLALLGDAEREPAPRRVHHVREVDEHALRGLGAQPDLRRVLLHRADERLEHEVELPRRGERAAALRAARRVGRLAARDAARPRDGPHASASCTCPVQSTRGSVKPATCPLATHTSGFMRIDRLDALDVVAKVHHRLPPALPDVAAQAHTERSEVVHSVEPAVDLARRVHEAALLAQRDELLDDVRLRRVLGHGGSVYRQPTRHPGPRWPGARRSIAAGGRGDGRARPRRFAPASAASAHRGGGATRAPRRRRLPRAAL